MQVLSRAALLLRVATGACSRLLSKSGVDLEDLEFWWLFLGESRGLWEPTEFPGSLEDLWQEVEEALETVSNWENSSAADVSYANWHRKCAPQNIILGGCELIALWGLDF